MNRRSFLQRAGLGVAAVPFVPVSVGAFGWKTEDTPKLGAGVHVLGEVPTDRAARLVKMLSDDVFERLCRNLRNRNFRVTTGERIGEDDLAEQWNTGRRVSLDYASDTPPVFPVAQFRESTDRWVRGHVMSTDVKLGAPTHEAFSGMHVMGMAFLPLGLLWCAHYVDESTGTVMRAVSQFDVVMGDLTVRWDVLCG